MTCEPYNEQRTKIFPDIRRDRNDRARAREREREKESGRKKGGGRGRKQDKRRRETENSKGSTFSLEKKPTRRANEKTKPEGYCFYENRNTFKTRAQKEEEDELKARERA